VGEALLPGRAVSRHLLSLGQAFRATEAKVRLHRGFTGSIFGVTPGDSGAL
jgi:hypothetical protein